MSQVTQPRIPVSQQLRAHRAALIAALLALGATVAVVLVLVLAIGQDGGATAEPVSPGAQQTLRPDGGPEESRTAASVGSRSSATGPDESRTAASISGR
jgi:hypothetical protein